MRSSIRNNRDRRGTQTHRETRYHTDAPSTVEKRSDAPFEAHGPSRQIDVPSSTDAKVDAAHELVRDQLIPRIRTMSANAALTDRREFYYFARKRSGRRCSCQLSETSPDAQCPVCLGVGLVGGYDKYGTMGELLDFTSPNLVMVNCEPNLSDDTRPVYLKLSDGYRQGYVEAVLPIRANIGVMDTFLLSQPIFNRGAKVKAFDPSNNFAYIQKPSDLAPFLKYDNVRIRIEFTRMDDKPMISHFMMRYQALDQTIVYGDVARLDGNLLGTEIGFFEIFQELPIFFDGKTLTNIQNEDIIYRLEDAKRFKIINVNENKPAGILTSTDTRARFLIPSIDHGAFNILI